ncbi:MAG: pilus assembly protein PilM [Neptuniibacter sp.]
MLSFFKKKATKGGLTSVVFTAEGVSIAHMQSTPTGSKLKFCEHYQTSSPLTEISRFSETVAINNMAGSNTVVVLPDDAYQILLIEKPDLPDEEVHDALRWRVKDLVSFDIEQAFIDYIELPEDAYRNRSQMIYVVVAQNKPVEKYISWCQEIGLHPSVVDVPELALLNLTEELADSEAGLAVFAVGEKSSSINLLSDESLYFTRQLSFSQESSPEQASSAVLELQRSMDYYESQIGKPPCVRLMVIPLMMEDEPLISELRYNLPLDIHSLNLENLVSTDIALSAELQKKATVAVASALRSIGELGESSA